MLAKHCNQQLSLFQQLETIYVTGFWKISPNVTFYTSNIHNHNEEKGHPINFTVIAIVQCISHQKLPAVLPEIM